MKKANYAGEFRRLALFYRIWILIVFSFFGCQTTKPLYQPLPRETLASFSLPVEGLNFLALGDWGRRGKHNQLGVAKQMGITARKMRVRFVALTGDNFYNKGVKSVRDPAWKISFEDVYTSASLMIPWYVTLGNHDHKGSVQAQINYSEISSRWKLPAPYYSAIENIDDTTCAQLVFIDTTPLMKLPKKRKKRQSMRNAQAYTQLQWLDSTLANSQCQWKIVFGHHPVYAAGAKHGQLRKMVIHLKPLLEKYGVQAYFSGHEHDLQYIKGEDSVNYFISGAGSKVHKVSHKERTIFSKGVSGFIAVSLTARKMRVFYIDYQGNVIYRASINR